MPVLDKQKVAHFHACWSEGTSFSPRTRPHLRPPHSAQHDSPGQNRGNKKDSFGTAARPATGFHRETPCQFHVKPKPMQTCPVPAQSAWLSSCSPVSVESEGVNVQRGAAWTAENRAASGLRTPPDWSDRSGNNLRVPQLHFSSQVGLSGPNMLFSSEQQPTQSSCETAYIEPAALPTRLRLLDA